MKTKLIIISVLLLLLAACSANQAVNPEPANPEPAGEQEDNSPEEIAEPVVEDPTPEPPEEQAEEPTAAVSFAADVLPILNSRCLTCHGGDRVEGGLVMLSYAELMQGSEKGPVILPGDAEASKLYSLAVSGEMPKRGANLNAVQLQTILDWINSGAQDN